jgi:hypothetical protein
MSEVETQLFDIFSSFIRDLSKTFPEIKNSLYRNYESCLVESKDKKLSDYPMLERFLELISDHEKYITDKNLEFFDLEVEFLEEISFKRLWTKNISNKTRESIWKYLQTFQIININLKSSKDLRNALSQIGTDTEVEVDRSTVKDLKKLKKLTEGVKEEVKGESELDDMLGGLMDTGIGDIAKEVAKNMDIESMFGNIDEDSNPMELMAQMMNPEKMGSIFENINSVMEKKMETGELTKDSLKSEAEGVMGKMGENPMFKNMMGQMDPNAMQQSMNTQNSSESESEKEYVSEPELTREEKQKLLREKIKEKKNNR